LKLPADVRSASANRRSLHHFKKERLQGPAKPAVPFSEPSCVPELQNLLLFPAMRLNGLNLQKNSKKTNRQIPPFSTGYKPKTDGGYLL
jgi:hypothetical protein